MSPDSFTSDLFVISRFSAASPIAWILAEIVSSLVPIDKTLWLTVLIEAIISAERVLRLATISAAFAILASACLAPIIYIAEI